MSVCRVARNLNQTAATGAWSLRGPSGRVIGWCSAVEVRYGRFVVSEAGHRKVLARGRRDVFAWVEGEIARLDGFVPNPKALEAADVALIETLQARPGGVPAAENNRVRFQLLDGSRRFLSYAETQFLDQAGRPVEAAARVRCTATGCYTGEEA